MGNATGMVVLYVCISMVSLLMVLGLQAVDPNSNYLFSNYLFSPDTNQPSGIIGENIVVQNNVWTFNNTLANGLPNRETAGSSSSDPSTTPTTLFPDWVYSGYNWALGAASGVVAAGKFLIDLVGAPYTILMMFGNSAISAILGAGFSIINLFILINWLIGRDN